MSSLQNQTANSAASHQRWRDSVYRKIGFRLIPCLFVGYLMAVFDRASVGFAKLEFLTQLGFSEAVYGFGAGLFFLGYMMFEVPSNIYLHKHGVRRTLLRIMVLWGLVTALTLFIRTPNEFYFARLALGMAEAGFLPGVVLYLTYWFPTDKKAQITALLLMAHPIAGILGGLLAGSIMTQFAGHFGLAGWQVLFLYMGVPTMILGVFSYFYLTDRPETATWLNDREKQLLQDEITNVDQGPKHAGMLSFLKDSRIYITALGYFTVVSSVTTLSLWGPSIIKELGVTDVSRIGPLSAIPYVVGVISMYLVGRSSDYFLERRWHFVGCSLLTAFGFVGLCLFHSDFTVAMVFLCIAAFGIFGGFPLYLTIPGSFLPRASAAGGIALVTTLGSFGGFLTPWLLGLMKSMTGTLYSGLLVAAGISLLGGLLVGVVMRSPRFHSQNH
ncbi:MFS transporter [Pseudomonas entomophila]|uniref:MFS transporter n=1 Tax=Pseudomonas entomophila TaxID=312306 RepID=UPI0023D8C797|nr:MFS transporter [Pseudomonas entomophila]MDF0732764.1 MFS transporter [Pseudomonas entomophila]